MPNGQKHLRFTKSSTTDTKLYTISTQWSNGVKHRKWNKFRFLTPTWTWTNSSGSNPVQQLAVMESAFLCAVMPKKSR